MEPATSLRSADGTQGEEEFVENELLAKSNQRKYMITGRSSKTSGSRSQTRLSVISPGAVCKHCCDWLAMLPVTDKAKRADSDHLEMRMV